MAIALKKASDIAVGDKIFALRAVTKITVEATKITFTYDDGSEDVHQPTDTLRTGDPTAP